MRTLEYEPTLCPFCNKLYTNTRDVEIHVFVEHSPKPTLPCPLFDRDVYIRPYDVYIRS